MIDWLLQTTEIPNWVIIMSGGVYGFAAGILISPPKL